MKILIFNSVFFPTQIGGAEKSVFNLAAGLKKQGHEVFVVSISESAVGIEKNTVPPGITCYYLQNLNTYWPFSTNANVSPIKKLIQKITDLYNLRYLKNLHRIFQEVSPDIVHTNNLKGFSVIVWKVAEEHNCRIIHTLRDYYLKCSKCTIRKNGRNCERTCWPCKSYSLPKKALSSKVSCVIGVSDFILKNHINDGYFRKARRKVIYNSAAAEYLPPPPRKMIGGPIYFGYIGRIEDEKGINILIARLQEANLHLDFKLVIAGDGDSKIIKKITSFDFVDYKGFMPTSDFFACIDYLIVPSLWHEPMGRVVPEAYSHGVPVLVNKVGGLAELVKDGVTGVYTNLLSYDDFSAAVRRLLELDYSETSKNCIHEYATYSNEKMVNSYLDALEMEIHG